MRLMSTNPIDLLEESSLVTWSLFEEVWNWDFRCFNNVSDSILDRDDQELVARLPSISTKTAISEGKITTNMDFLSQTSLGGAILDRDDQELVVHPSKHFNTKTAISEGKITTKSWLFEPKLIGGSNS